MYGPCAILGQVIDRGASSYIPTYQVVIPDVLVGNEWKPGYAAFSSDGVLVNRGVSTSSPVNFLGFFSNIYSQEAEASGNPFYTIFGDKFLVPVVFEGTIFVYNATAVNRQVGNGVRIVTSVDTLLVTDPNWQCGAVFQGTPPVGVTYTEIQTRARIMSESTTPGSGVFVRSIS
jgi:hypothetical protein